MIDRRDFLKISGQGVVLLGAMSVVNACGGVKRDDLARWNGEQGAVHGLGQDEMEMLYLASLAPSSHNTQPWTVRVAEPKRWLIGSAKQCRLPAVDPHNRELLLSIGAFLENLVIAAGIYGYAADIHITANSPFDDEIAEVRLKKGKVIDFPVEKIIKRRTIRSGHLDAAIKAADLQYLTRHDTERLAPLNMPAPHSFYFPQGSPQAKYLQEGTIEANRAQAFRDPAQEELADWIRFSNKAAKLHRNGLTPASMEIQGFAGWFVRNFYDRDAVLKQRFRDQTVDVVARQVKTCGGWVVVTSADAQIQTLIAYGRVFENVLLKARDRLIAVHPMTQMLEEKPWQDDVARELGVAGEVQWILRIGYVQSYPDPVSLRVPVARFVRS